MAIKTDAMIAHNGAEGYTLHVDYDPETDGFDLKAVFNDGSVKELDGTLVDGSTLNMLISRNITNFKTDAPVIGQNAFRGCRQLVTLIINKATSVDAAGMGYCFALKYVYISDACTAINSTAFDHTTQSDLVIDCGFSADSSAAAGAPWGATGATINYDVSAPNPPAVSALSMTPAPDLIQNIDMEPLEEIQPVEPEPVEVKKTTKRRSK